MVEAQRATRHAALVLAYNARVQQASLLTLSGETIRATSTQVSFTSSTIHLQNTMMRETDELLPTTAARIVDPPRSRPRALALTLAVALCAASAIAGTSFASAASRPPRRRRASCGSRRGGPGGVELALFRVRVNIPPNVPFLAVSEIGAWQSLACLSC